MRVGVDGFNLASRQGTGVATYARTLTSCLQGMGHDVDVIYGMNISARTEPDLREIIFFDSLDQEHVRKPPKPFTARWWSEQKSNFGGLKGVEVPMSGRVESRGFAHRMPAYDRILNVPALFRHAACHFRRTNRFLTIKVENTPAIMHWTSPLPIRLEGAQNIYTIHDLTPLRLPYATPEDKSVHFRLIAELAKSADMLCTVSEASRRDILAYHPGAEQKVFNTYQSFKPNARLLARSEADIVAELEGLFELTPDGYFLFLGALEPTKNIGRMIEAFLATPTSRPLVIVGEMAWKSESELRFLKRAQESGRVRHLEYLPETTLTGLVRCARAVLFPSLSEGFGLPVLEALSLGTPVLTSREGALPEVAGEAAIFVDAYDTSMIAAGIAHLDVDDATCSGLRALGPVQAAQFSVPAYQERLGEMYNAALRR
jgi:glycosyltransferase involved in cell wall biosynthesis